MEQSLRGVEGIIFELDSVLFDKAEWVVPATEYAAKQMRLDANRAVGLANEYIAKHGGADPQIYNAILLGCGQFDTAMNLRAFTTLINQFQPPSRSIQLYPGVEDTLVALRAGYKLAVVTDGPPDTQKRKMIALGLNELIGHVVYSDEIEGLKSRLPDSRPLLLAASMLRLRPDQLLFVGHNPVKHFQRTREIGFVTMRVMSGEYGRQDYLSEDHRAEFDVSSVASLNLLLGLTKTPDVFADGWGIEQSWQPDEVDSSPPLTAASFPIGTQFEDAAFAALFQMTSGMPESQDSATDLPSKQDGPVMKGEVDAGTIIKDELLLASGNEGAASGAAPMLGFEVGHGLDNATATADDPLGSRSEVVVQVADDQFLGSGGPTQPEETPPLEKATGRSDPETAKPEDAVVDETEVLDFATL